MRLIPLLIMVIALAGCGSGGNFAFAPGTIVSRTRVTDFWPNGQMKDTGFIATDSQGNTVKVDQWQYWYDNGQPQWQGTYTSSGAIDAGQPWFEWNSNGSMRDTWVDR